MGLIKKIVVIEGIRSLGKVIEKAETKRRMTPLNPSSIINKESFTKFCLKTGSEIPEILKCEMDGSVVRIEYKPKGAIIKKYARIDFNDHGAITGKYWILECNDRNQSSNEIVNSFAKGVQKRIEGEQFIKKYGKSDLQESEKDSFSLICPFCGYIGLSDMATVCPICGADF